VDVLMTINIQLARDVCKCMTLIILSDVY